MRQAAGRSRQKEQKEHIYTSSGANTCAAIKHRYTKLTSATVHDQEPHAELLITHVFQALGMGEIKC